MPVYNLSSSVADLIKNATSKFSDVLPKFELVVVDDGSKDGTMLQAIAVQDRRVRVVGYDHNRGKGEALLYGSRFAAGDVVIMADGDLQATPLELNLYLGAIAESDIVIGSKRVMGAVLDAGFKRRFLSTGFSVLVKILLSLPLSDTQVGFKVFRKSALLKIIPLISVKHYAFDVELLTVAHLLGLKITELPAKVKLEAKFHNKNMLRMLVDLLGIAYRLRIRHWYQHNLAKGKHYEPKLRW